MQRCKKLVRCAALVGALACVYSGVVRDWRSAAILTGGIPELDSFSEAGIAAAILKKRSEDLIWAYRMRREVETLTPSPIGRAAVKEAGMAPEQPSSNADTKPVNDLSKGTSEWIARLRRESAELREIALASDLESQLLVIYRENGLWDEFLDCYLGILGRSPESEPVVVWARSALEYSSGCGRAEEVQDALRHLGRFSRNTRVRVLVRAALDDWSSSTRQTASAGKT